MSAELRYYVGGSPTEITLRGPSFGDSISRPHKAKLHLSMAGTITTTKRTQTSSKLMLAFDDLTLTEWTNLRSFIALADGNEFRYIGPQGSWYVRAQGIIERAARNKNFYSVTLELTGTESADTNQLLRLMDDTGYLVLQSGSYLLLQEV